MSEDPEATDHVHCVRCGREMAGDDAVQLPVGLTCLSCIDAHAHAEATALARRSATKSLSWWATLAILAFAADWLLPSVAGMSLKAVGFVAMGLALASLFRLAKAR